ncbi:MAG: hypothetical protein ACLGIG_03510 [Actinomycetes bacterium]
MTDLTALPRAALAPVAAPAARGGARLLTAVGAGVVRAASLVRGERVIHAKGTTVAGRMRVAGGAGVGVPLFDEPGSWDVLVRFSRSLGLPDRLPDVLGVALRVQDAHGPGQHQDLLLDSTLPLPLVRRLPVPQYDLLGALYTSLTSYELGGRRYLLGLLPDAGAPGVRAVSELAGRGDGARLRLAASVDGAWRELAVLELGRGVPDGREVRFSPDVTGGGIRPAGWLQDLRQDAYRASHVGHDA